MTTRMTYHGPGGRFCPPDYARVASKGGERFKVVRNYQRVCGGASQDVRTHTRRPPGTQVPNHDDAVAVAASSAEAVVNRGAAIREAVKSKLVRISDLVG